MEVSSMIKQQTFKKETGHYPKHGDDNNIGSGETDIQICHGGSARHNPAQT